MSAGVSDSCLTTMPGEVFCSLHHLSIPSRAGSAQYSGTEVGALMLMWKCRRAIFHARVPMWFSHACAVCAMCGVNQAPDRFSPIHERQVQVVKSHSSARPGPSLVQALSLGEPDHHRPSLRRSTSHPSGREAEPMVVCGCSAPVRGLYRYRCPAGRIRWRCQTAPIACSVRPSSTDARGNGGIAARQSSRNRSVFDPQVVR